MGLFDRFKKKAEPERKAAQSSVFEDREPLLLKHSDGRKDKIYFNGIVEIDGKKLMSVEIEQAVSEDGTSAQKTYLVEPRYEQDEHGNFVDVTEQYYREMGIHPQEGGDPRKYNAIKGFFQTRDITKEKIGSNYIGGVVYNKETGMYNRKYDEAFRSKYIARIRQQDIESKVEVHQKDIAAEQEKQAIKSTGRKLQNIYADMEAGKATPEAVDYYYSKVGCRPENQKREILKEDDEANRSNRYTGMI